jgi:hypothetical protein
MDLVIWYVTATYRKYFNAVCPSGWKFAVPVVEAIKINEEHLMNSGERVWFHM